MSTNDLKERYIPRLLVKYREDFVPAMKEKFGYKNSIAVPRLVKVVINMGISEGINDAKIVDQAAKELGQISGQKAKICRAKKPISNFKLRKGLPIGCCVVLRRYRMYDFLDRMISIAMPRIRDFRGYSSTAFDGKGNYSFGIIEQTIFPELNLDKVTKTFGMNVTIVTTAKTDNEARELLTLFKFPFAK